MLNWKELELIISEANLQGCKIQTMVQGTFHSVTWLLYNPDRGRFSFYTEVGTQESRMNIVSNPGKPPKTDKLQRFEQFARKNLEGSVIKKSYTLPYDRVAVWELDNHGRKLNIYQRLYSGSGANIIVTDENNIILDLLLRRPGRNETSGCVFKPEQVITPFECQIRHYEGSFNSYIEQIYLKQSQHETVEKLRKQVTSAKEKALSRLSSSINSQNNAIAGNCNYESLCKQADMFASCIHNVRKGDSKVTLTDEYGNTTIINIDRQKTPGENLQAFYERYKKAKGAYDNACIELERLKKEYNSVRERFDNALTEGTDEEENIRKLAAVLKTNDKDTEPDDKWPGIKCTSGGFTIIAGRNANENDEILRHYAKPSDTWFHTRDYPGGFVFVRFKRNKTIPLDVMLDAANIAVLFSKARNEKKVDLYYTQVRYLRRAKDGKKGLVLPTHEKNITIAPDRSRTDKLLNGQELTPKEDSL